MRGLLKICAIALIIEYHISGSNSLPTDAESSKRIGRGFMGMFSSDSDDSSQSKPKSSGSKGSSSQSKSKNSGSKGSSSSKSVAKASESEDSSSSQSESISSGSKGSGSFKLVAKASESEESSSSKSMAKASESEGSSSSQSESKASASEEPSSSKVKKTKNRKKTQDKDNSDEEQGNSGGESFTSYGFGSTKKIKGAGRGMSGSSSTDSDSLPFPIAPSEFWEFAINLVSEHYSHFFPAIIPNPTFEWANGSHILTGPFIGGILLTLTARAKREGKKKKETAVELIVTIKDYVFFNLDGSIIMDSFALTVDNILGADEPEPSVLLSLDPEKVIKKFATDFEDPLKWPEYAAKFKENPKKFVTPYLELFYPASISIYINGKIDTINGLIDKKVTSKHRINLVAFDLKSHIPEKVWFSTNQTIEMIDDKGETVVRIPTFDMITSHTCCEHAATGKLVIPAIKVLFGVIGGVKKAALELPKMKGYVHVSVHN